MPCPAGTPDVTCTQHQVRKVALETPTELLDAFLTGWHLFFYQLHPDGPILQGLKVFRKVPGAMHHL